MRSFGPQIGRSLTFLWTFLVICQPLHARLLSPGSDPLIESGPFRFRSFFAENQRGPSSSACQSKMCLELLGQIKQAKTSIEFAIYGLRNQEDIRLALVHAKQRGVTVRGVVDSRNRYCGAKGKYMYEGTKDLIQSLGGPEVVRCDNKSGHSYIMHNKFFVFDKTAVWTGSTNVSDKGVGGECHANSSILLRSRHLAKIYSDRFEELYAGQHHKNSSPSKQAPVLWGDGSLARVAFAPSDDPSTNLIAPALANAELSLSVAMFFFSDQNLAQELCAAALRGASVRVILDPRGASSAGSQYDYLCKHGVEVKVSNWQHKMHMKTAVIDHESPNDAAVILGSQNWTNSGNSQNDENVMFVQNHQLAQDVAVEFERLWLDLAELEICRPLRPENLEPFIPRRSQRHLPRAEF